MISSSVHTTIFNKKIIDYVEEEGEFVSQKDIAKVNAELIRELEELYEDNEIEEDLI